MYAYLNVISVFMRSLVRYLSLTSVAIYVCSLLIERAYSLLKSFIRLFNAHVVTIVLIRSMFIFEIVHHTTTTKTLPLNNLIRPIYSVNHSFDVWFNMSCDRSFDTQLFYWCTQYSTQSPINLFSLHWIRLLCCLMSILPSYADYINHLQSMLIWHDLYPKHCTCYTFVYLTWSPINPFSLYWRWHLYHLASMLLPYAKYTDLLQSMLLWHDLYSKQRVYSDSLHLQYIDRIDANIPSLI